MKPRPAALGFPRMGVRPAAGERRRPCRVPRVHAEGGGCLEKTPGLTGERVRTCHPCPRPPAVPPGTGPHALWHGVLPCLLPPSMSNAWTMRKMVAGPKYQPESCRGLAGAALAQLCVAETPALAFLGTEPGRVLWSQNSLKFGSERNRKEGLPPRPPPPAPDGPQEVLEFGERQNQRKNRAQPRAGPGLALRASCTRAFVGRAHSPQMVPGRAATSNAGARPITCRVCGFQRGAR